MNGVTLDVRSRDDLSSADVDRLRSIHAEAFPPEEQQYSMDYMLQRVGDPDSALRIIKVNDAIAGYLYLELSPQQATAFLWYLAVAVGQRDAGLGGSAVRDTLDLLRREHPDLRYVLFEVHTPVAEHGLERQDLYRRRIEFYRRLGAHWVQGVRYRVPAEGDPTRSVAYDPMFFALHGSFDSDEVRDRVLLMASGNFDDAPDDPRWHRLQHSMMNMTIVSPADRTEKIGLRRG